MIKKELVLLHIFQYFNLKVQLVLIVLDKNENNMSIRMLTRAGDTCHYEDVPFVDRNQYFHFRKKMTVFKRSSDFVHWIL